MRRRHADEVLIRRAVAGDKQAFGELYERHLDEVYRYIFYRTADPREAEDLTETVFLKVWEALPRFRPEETSFRTWLYRVAHNLVVDHYRTRKTATQLEEGSALPDPSPSPEQQIMAREREQQIARWIAKLPPDYQQVLTLRFVQDLSHAETAQILGRSEAAVRVLQYRALRALRKVIAEEQSHGR